MQIFLSSLVYIVIIIFYPICSWAAEPVILEKNGGEYPIALHLDILEDKKGVWTIKDVTSPELSARFVPNKMDFPNYGITDSAYWVRFTARNNSPEEKEWLLEIAFPLFDHVDLYTSEPSGNFIVKKSGMTLPFKERGEEHRNFVFRLILDYGAEKTYYLRFKTIDLMSLPITIWSKFSFYKKDDREYFILGSYYGTIAVMVLYNLFIFFFLKDRNYLFYSLYISSHAALQLCLNGIANEYIWPDFSGSWNQHSREFFVFTSIFFAIIFSKSFLSTKKNTPKLDKALQILMGLISILLFLISITPSPTIIKILFLCSIIITLLIVSAGILCWRKGYKPAKYFIIAWIALLIGSSLISLTILNILPFSFITYNGMQIGSAFETFLLSLALADRINILNEEKRNLTNTVELRKREAVEERECIKREIHDSIGSSFVKAMLLTDAIKRGDEVDLKELKQVLTEGLSDSRELITVEEGNNTLGEIVSYTKEIARSLQGLNRIKCIVSSEIKDEGIYISSAVKLNLIRIIQECITNIIKHAEATMIDLALSEKDREITIRIKDNGRGFNPAIHSKGYGFKNIRKRSDDIGARLIINSEPFRGTEIEVALKLSSLPLQPPPL